MAKMLLPALLFALSMLGILPSTAKAQTVDPAIKITADLKFVIAAPFTPSVSWAKDVSGQRYVKALVIGNSADPDLPALRNDVLAKGGSVHFRYLSVAALSVMLPANRVADIAIAPTLRKC